MNFPFLSELNGNNPVHRWQSFCEEPINGEQTRVPFRWSWKEGWEISMFLMPLSQPDKSVKTASNRTCNGCSSSDCKAGAEADGEMKIKKSGRDVGLL